MKAEGLVARSLRGLYPCLFGMTARSGYLCTIISAKSVAIYTNINN
jgi:hypothetical protein